MFNRAIEQIFSKRKVIHKNQVDFSKVYIEK